MFHEKLSVGTENNFQENMNCQLIILYGLLNSDNNIHENLFKGGVKNTQTKKKREYTDKLYKKDLNDPDNHNGVISHLEPDILESEVRRII